MNIKPIRSYIPVNTGLRKVLPAVIAVSAVTAPVLTSCNIDNRQNNHKVDWFAVEFNRLSDEDVRKSIKQDRRRKTPYLQKLMKPRLNIIQTVKVTDAVVKSKPADGIMNLLTTEAEWKPAQQLFLKDLVLKKMLWDSFM